jgi:hypothetical protein
MCDRFSTTCNDYYMIRDDYPSPLLCGSVCNPDRKTVRSPPAHTRCRRQTAENAPPRITYINTTFQNVFPARSGIAVLRGKNPRISIRSRDSKFKILNAVRVVVYNTRVDITFIYRVRVNLFFLSVQYDDDKLIAKFVFQRRSLYSKVP